MDKSVSAPKFKRSSEEPALSPKFIFLVFTSRFPPSCGEVSDTKSVLIPVRFDPSIAGNVPC